MARFSGVPPIWAAVGVGLLSAPLAGYVVMLRCLRDAEKAVPGFLYGWMIYAVALLALGFALKAARLYDAWRVAALICTGLSVATTCLFGTIPS